MSSQCKVNALLPLQEGEGGTMVALSHGQWSKLLLNRSQSADDGDVSQDLSMYFDELSEASNLPRKEIEDNISRLTHIIQKKSASIRRTLTLPYFNSGVKLVYIYDEEHDDEIRNRMFIKQVCETNRAGEELPDTILIFGERNGIDNDPYQEAIDTFSELLGLQPDLVQTGVVKWSEYKLTAMRGGALRSLEKTPENGHSDDIGSQEQLQRSTDAFAQLLGDNHYVLHLNTSCTFIDACSDKVKSQCLLASLTCSYFLSLGGCVMPSGNNVCNPSSHARFITFNAEHNIPVLEIHMTTLGYKGSRLSDYPAWSKVLNGKNNRPKRHRGNIASSWSLAFKWLAQVRASTNTTTPQELVQSLDAEIDEAMRSVYDTPAERPSWTVDATGTHNYLAESVRRTIERRLGSIAKLMHNPLDNSCGDVVGEALDGRDPPMKLCVPVEVVSDRESDVNSYTVSPSSNRYMVVCGDEEAFSHRFSDAMRYFDELWKSRSGSSKAEVFDIVDNKVARESRLFHHLMAISVGKVLDGDLLSGHKHESHIRSNLQTSVANALSGPMHKIANAALGECSETDQNLCEP